MGRYWFAALALVAFAHLDLGSVADASETRSARSTDAATISDVSAQSRRQRRANLRIIVRPPGVGPPRFQFDEFPRPYPYDWPGPGFVRDCVGWLEPEWRPSGTVIVPRRRCAWVRG
jgi:hypothetical protein